MRHIDERCASRLERPHRLVEQTSLTASESGGWLVEHDEPRVADNRTDDLDLLLMGDGQVSDPGGRRDRHPQLRRDILVRIRHLGAVEAVNHAELDPQEHVVEH